MKITKINISGFGIHKDFKLDELSPHFTVFYGQNEKGKTTLKKFISSILFGFESRRRVDRYPPINGGSYGGYLDLQTNKQVVRVKRIEGSKAKSNIKAKLSTLHGQEVKDLAELFPPGFNKKIFENVFCFDINQLQNFKSLHQEELTGYLQGAGFGVDVNSVVQNLTKETEQLYSPQSTKKKVNSLFIQLDEISKKEDKARLEADKIPMLEQKIKEVNSQLVNQKKLREGLENEINKLEKLNKIRPAYFSLLEIEALLQSLPSKVVDSNHVSSALEIEKEIEYLKNELDQIRIEEERIQIEQSQKKPEKLLLTMEDQINKAAMEANIAREKPPLFKLKEELESKKEQVEKLLESAYFYGDNQELLSVNTSSCSTILDNINDEYSKLSSESEYLEKEQQKVEKRLEEISLKVNERDFKEQKKLFNRLQYLKGQLSGQTAKKGYTFSFLSLGLVALTVFAGFFGIITTGASTLIAFVGSCVFFISLSYEFNSYLKRKRQENMVNKEIIKICAKLGTSSDESSMLRQNERLNNLAYLLEEREKLLSIQKKLKHQKQSTDKKLEDLQKRKSELLINININQGQSIKEAKIAIEKIGRCQQILYDIKRKESQLREAEGKVNKFVKSVSDLVNRIYKGDTVETLEDSLVNLNKLENQLNLHKKYKTEQEKIEKELAMLGQRKQILSQQLEDKNNKLSKLYSDTETKSLEQLKERYKKSKHKDELLSKMHKLKMEISLSPWERKEIGKELEKIKGTDIDEKIGKYKIQKKDADNKIDNLLNEYGKLENQLDTLKNSQVLENLQYEKETLNSELTEALSHYYSLSIGKKILENAMEAHKNKRQPGVLDRASRYFKQITSNEYLKVVSDEEKNTFKAITKEGEKLLPTQLSRGTQEQLFLSIRLALAVEFAQANKPLPLVVDDIMVNFDKERRKQVLKVIKDVSKKIQILFFTCHDYMVDEISYEFGDNSSIVNL
ncbi:AAA family ATPase [Proteinivorax hydrogeniformans]|uniref:AAA family ATPase n=1 Tax=Proteinivorax hydrogeniformans TaxID=1826727 RepID=A0AAU8HTT0_9FIRM